MTARKPNPMPRSQIARLGGIASQRMGKYRRFTTDNADLAREKSGRTNQARASDPEWQAKYKAWGRKGGMAPKRRQEISGQQTILDQGDR